MGKTLKRKLKEKEKENGCMSTSDLKKPQLPRCDSSHDLPLILKEKVRRRLVKSNETWSKFDSDMKKIQNSLLKIVDLIEACRSIATVERGGNDSLINVLQDKNSNAISCKTNIVTPMIRGLPLKKVTISLKRIAPIQMQNYLIQSSSSASSASQGSSTESENRNSRQQHVEASTSVSGFTRSHSSSGRSRSSHH